MSDINSLRRIGARVVHKTRVRGGVVKALGVSTHDAPSDFVLVHWAGDPDNHRHYEWVRLEALELAGPQRPLTAHDLVLHAPKFGRTRLGVVQEVLPAAVSYPYPTHEPVVHVRWLSGEMQWMRAAELRLAREGDIAQSVHSEPQTDLLKRIEQRVGALEERLQQDREAAEMAKAHETPLVNQDEADALKEIRHIVEHHAAPGRSLPDQVRQLLLAENALVTGRVNITNRLRVALGQEKLPRPDGHPLDVRQALGNVLEDVELKLYESQRSGVLHWKTAFQTEEKKSKAYEGLFARIGAKLPTRSPEEITELVVALIDRRAEEAKSLAMSDAESASAEALDKLKEALGMENASPMEVLAAANDVVRRPAQAIDASLADAARELREVLQPAEEASLALVIGAAVEEIQNLRTDKRVFKKQLEAFDGCVPLLGGLRERISGLGNGPAPYARVLEEVTRRLDSAYREDDKSQIEALREELNKTALRLTPEVPFAIVIAQATQDLQKLKKKLDRIYAAHTKALDKVNALEAERRRLGLVLQMPVATLTELVDAVAAAQKAASFVADQTKPNAAFVELLHKPYDAGGAASRGWALMKLLRDAGHPARGFMAGGSMPLFRGAGMDPYRMKGLVGLEGAAMLLNAFAWDAGLIGTLRAMFPEPDEGALVGEKLANKISESDKTIVKKADFAAGDKVRLAEHYTDKLRENHGVGVVQRKGGYGDLADNPNWVLVRWPNGLESAWPLKDLAHDIEDKPALAKGDKVRLKDPKVTGNLHHPAHLVGTINKIGEATRENAAWATVTWSDGVTNMFPIDLLERAPDEKKS